MSRPVSPATPPPAVVVLTGAASGIGLVTAQTLARRGYRLALADLNAPAAQRLAHELDPSGSRVIALPTDVTQDAQRRRLIAQAREHFGHIDALINNAGVAVQRGYWWDDPDPLRITRVNLEAPIELVRLVLPEMRARRSGHIVNIGSVAAHVGSNGMYSASKFGIRGFTVGLRRELLGSGVQVSLISPGFVRTAMTHNARLPLLSPQLVADAVAATLLRPRREVILPWIYRPLIFLERLIPAASDWVVRYGVLGRWELSGSPREGRRDRAQ